MEKIKLSAQRAQYDLACACGGGQTRTLDSNGRWIYPVALPNGETLPVLKVLQFSGCERSCFYCFERLGGRGKNFCFHPDELSQTFMDLVRAGLVKGLFLSSAIRRSPIYTMDCMLGTLERIRFKHQFRGFVHIKIIPGADENQIIRAMQLAERVSVNLEAPTQKSLAAVAPGKDYDSQIIFAMRTVAKNLGRQDLRCKSHTTQYVVGAAGEKDRQIVESLWNSYRELDLGRGYFSAFQPIIDTPLENMMPTPAMREHRLYQTDFLFRKYGFNYEDIVFDNDENLSLSDDPKMRWVSLHPELFPVEINKAEKAELLRVPGIGPEAASRIVKYRKKSPITDLDGLKTATARWRIAAPYLLFNGKIRAERQIQLSLF